MPGVRFTELSNSALGIDARQDRMPSYAFALFVPIAIIFKRMTPSEVYTAACDRIRPRSSMDRALVS